MSRNDSALVGAMSSSSPVRLVPPSTRKRREESADKHKLEPKAEAVLKFLAAEKERLTSVKHIMFDAQMNDDKKVAALQRQRDQYEYVEKLEKQMKQLLGVVSLPARSSIPPMPHENIPPMPGETKS